VVKISNIAFIFLLLQTSLLLGQRDIQFTQFAHNNYIHNPSLAGLNESLTINALARFQWVGLKGAPFSQALSADIPVPKLKSGWGVLITNDIIGAATISTLQFTYAYHLKLSKKSRLSFGLSLGANSQFLNNSKLITPTGNYVDAEIAHNDNLLGVENRNAIGLSSSLGVNFEISDLIIGLAFNELSNSLNNIEKNTLSGINGQNLTLNSKYKLYLGRQWEFAPSVLVKTNIKYHQVDIQANFEFNSFILFGIGYRGYNNSTSDALIGLFGLNLAEKLRLVYSYDFSLSPLRQTSIGSHEVGMQYAINGKWNKSKNVKKIYNPRNL